MRSGPFRALAACALFSFAAAGQQGPAPEPQPLPCETAPEVEARVHYERALRAWLEGRTDDARAEVRGGIDASPDGRFAAPLRSLLARIDEGRPTPAQAARAAASTASAGSRAEMIVSATVEGGAIGGLIAAAGNADAKPAVALVMGFTGLGLVGSIALTSGVRLPPGLPPLFTLGGFYGAFAVGMGAYLSDSRGNIAGPLAAGVAGASAIGALAATSLDLTAGDAGAAWTGFLYGGGLPVLIELSALGTQDDHGKLYAATALIGSTVGALALPALNRDLRWSRGRYTLVELGGGVGALVGAGAAVLTDAFSNGRDGRFGTGLIAGGAVVGLAISTLATKHFDDDDAAGPPPRALLDLRPGAPARLGALTDALKPTFVAGKDGKPALAATLSLLGGAF